jgi:hypothetical protein
VPVNAQSGGVSVITSGFAQSNSVNLTVTGAAAGLSPSSLTFTSQAVGGTSAARAITLNNTGNAALSLTSIAFTGTNPADFAQSNNCGASVAAGANCTISVTFTPTASGVRSAAVTLTDNATGSPQTVSLTGTVVVAPPVITSATTASVRVGSTVAFPIAATNTPTSYGATGLPAGLSVSSGTGLISGTPTSTGTSAVTLSATNAVGTGNAALTLTIAAPLPAPFAQIIANKTNATPSAMSLSFPANTLGGDLILVALAYDISATASVSDSQGNIFTPVGNQLSAPGGQFSQLYYATNIKGGADTVTVTLSANSGYLDVYLSEYSGINPTNPIDAQASASGSAGTVSSGNAATTVAGDVIYGYCLGSPFCTVGSGFAARSTFDGNLSEDLLAGNAGSYAATGSATGGWAMQMVALKPASSSTGSAPVASLSPTSLTFASQAVGATSAAQAITLNNTGNAALSITSIGLSGANPGDFAQSNSCGASVAAGANCTISVTFMPTANGTRSAAVTLTDNATGSPQSVSLTGTGTAPVASLSPSSLVFGNEPVDMNSSSQVVSLNNTGSAALSITTIAFIGADPADFTENSTCGSSVAAGGNCTIAITFTPSAAGTRGASLSISDNASGSPQSVALSGTGTHDVILNWTASTTPGVAGYNVYRGTTSGGESPTPLNSSPINGTTYADENVAAGAEYYYVVMSVASNDVTLSAASNEASAAVPSP